MQEEKADFLRVGALAQRIQGYKKYEYWITIWDDCGKLDGVLRDVVRSNIIFNLESYAFAPKINDPIKIKTYDFSNGLIPETYYSINRFIIQKLLYLREENLSLFKPYLTAQDIEDLKELIQISLISQEEKILSLAFLFMVSSKKHNAFLLSLDKQESFYKRMQVFEQEKEIFEIYLENKIDFLKVLNFAFCPTSSYAFAEYLLNTFTKEILASFYVGMNRYIRFLNVSVERYNDSRLFPYKEVDFTPTPFRLIDICLLQAFFSARLDLMLLLEQKGANYEIFNTIFSLSAEEFHHYHLNHLTTMHNLLEYTHHNALEYLLKKGIRNQRFLESVLVGANHFVRSFSSAKEYTKYHAIQFIIANQDNEELNEEFRLYAKHTAFIEKSNAKAIQGIQIINETLRPYIDEGSPYYGFVNLEFNALLNPLAEERYNLLPESMERIFVYCVQNCPKIFGVQFDSNYLKSLPRVVDKIAAKRRTYSFIKDEIKNNRDINYEF